MYRFAPLATAAALCVTGACTGESGTHQSAARSRDTQPLAADEFRKLRGQWRGAEVGTTAVWTFSFGDAYAVVVRDPDDELYEGFAVFHTQLGAGVDGQIHVPPGSGVVDVDIVNATSDRYRGKTSLGAYYFSSPIELKLCISRPGLHHRAQAYETSSEWIRCFRLTKASDEPARHSLAEAPLKGR